MGQASKLKAAFGPKGDDLIASLKNERAMAQAENKILQGSATAYRLAAKEDAGLDPGAFGDAIKDGVKGNYASAVGNIFKGIKNRMTAGPSATQDEIGQIMFKSGAAHVDDIEAQLMRRSNLNAMGASRQGRLGAAATVGSSQGMGRGVSR